MDDINGAASTNAGKVYKSNQKKSKEQSELFYVKKRGLFRKAEQVVRYCNSEVFIIVHNLDNDKIFSFTSDKDFDLEKISDLVLRDCQQGAYLNKNKKFENTDFEKVKQNIMQIQKINSAQSQLASPHHQQHQLMDKEQMIPEETITEDMSVSMQQIGSNNETSAPNVGNPKLIRSPKSGHQLTFNSHSNQGTYENQAFSPTHVNRPHDQNIAFYQQQQPVQIVNYATHPQFAAQNAPPGPQNGGAYPHQNMALMTQSRVNQQQQNVDHDFNMNGTSQSAVQQQYQQVQKSPIRTMDNYNQQMHTSQTKQVVYPFQAASTSLVESNQSFDNPGQVNDVNHYRNQEYKQRFQKQQLDHAVNNDDIFTCYDFDYPRQSPLAATIPGKSGVDKRQNPFVKNQSHITQKSGNSIIKMPNQHSGVQYRSDISENRQQLQKPPKINSLVNDRPNRENNFGQAPNQQRHPHQKQLWSPSSNFDVADQVLTSPRNAPMDTNRVKAVRRYTGLHQDQRSGVISQAHISQISVDKPQNGGYLNSQLSEDQMDDPQYADQRRKITSGVLMATSQIQQHPNFGGLSNVVQNRNVSQAQHQQQQHEQQQRHYQEGNMQPHEKVSYMQSIGEQHIYNISYNYPQGKRTSHLPGMMVMDKQQQYAQDNQQVNRVHTGDMSQNYSQLRNHSPTPAKHQVHSQEIYKEQKMNADQMQYEHTQQFNQTKGEFRVSDVVINNNKEFYPMKVEQEGFSLQYNNNSGGTKNLSQLSRKNYSQLSQNRKRSGSGNGSNNSGVRSNRSNTYIQEHH